MRKKTNHSNVMYVISVQNPLMVCQCTKENTEMFFMEKKQTQKNHSSVMYVLLVQYSLVTLLSTKDNTRKAIFMEKTPICQVIYKENKNERIIIEKSQRPTHHSNVISVISVLSHLMVFQCTRENTEIINLEIYQR